MKGRLVQCVIVTAAIGMVVAANPSAAPRPKPLADIPGRFVVQQPCYSVPLFPADRISGDDCLGNPYQADSDGTRIILNTNREFRASLYGTRFVALDFTELVAGSECVVGCFRTFDNLVEPQPNMYPPEGPYRVVMQTNVVDIDGVEVPNGLLGFAPGTSSYARFFVSFEDPGGRDFHWSAIFNPNEYPGSNHVKVSRLDPCTWTIHATVTGADGNGSTGARAGLRAWSVRKGKNGNSDEGLFSMPFAMTFTAPNCEA